MSRKNENWCTSERQTATSEREKWNEKKKYEKHKKRIVNKAVFILSFELNTRKLQKEKENKIFLNCDAAQMSRKVENISQFFCCWQNWISIPANTKNTTRSHSGWVTCSRFKCKHWKCEMKKTHAKLIYASRDILWMNFSGAFFTQFIEANSHLCTLCKWNWNCATKNKKRTLHNRDKMRQTTAFSAWRHHAIERSNAPVR